MGMRPLRGDDACQSTVIDGRVVQPAADALEELDSVGIDDSRFVLAREKRRQPDVVEGSSALDVVRAELPLLPSVSVKL
jgi:hypothetical protein